MDASEVEKFVRDMIHGAANSAPVLIVKAMGQVMVDCQRGYHAGHLDADGLPV